MKKIRIVLILFMCFAVGAQWISIEAADYAINNPTIDSQKVTTWDCIWFGNYWQSDTNGDGVADQNDEKEPIKWRVLSVDGDDAFLLADKVLDCQLYSNNFDLESWGSATWETSTLRTWLNQDFYTNAFNSDEQNAIKTTDVVNEDNPVYETKAGNSTSDKIYLLSGFEADSTAYGLSTNPSPVTDYVMVQEGRMQRWADATDYAKKQGVHLDLISEYGYKAQWWLRTPGNDSASAAFVDTQGYIDYYGPYVFFRNYGVRPVLHIDLSLPIWTKGDCVTSIDGKIDNQATNSGEVNHNSSSAVNESIQIEQIKEEDTNKKNVENYKVTTLAKVEFLNFKNKKNKTIEASWKYVSGAKGYQIQYALNKKFTKKKKSKYTKKTKYTIKKLKKKTTYYFRVRAYKLSGKKKVYGKWSKVKGVKIK